MSTPSSSSSSAPPSTRFSDARPPSLASVLERGNPSLEEMKERTERLAVETKKFAASSLLRKPPFNLRRFAFFPLIFSALAFTAFAAFSTLTHTHVHPLQLLSRLIGTPAPVAYSSEQQCDMSYFHLSHKRIEITELSSMSQQILEGKVRFGNSSMTDGSGAASKPSSRRRSSSEFDDDEAVEDDSPPPSSPSLSPDEAVRRKNQKEEFHVLLDAMRNAMPSELVKGASAQYKLLQYVEHEGGREKYDRRKGEKRVPVLFIPGNAGNYHQMRSLASRLNTVWKTHSSSSSLSDLNDYYTLDFHEESSAFQGLLLWRQAWFANEALQFVLNGYPAGTNAILVAHSMAGIVARGKYCDKRRECVC
jgi:hypothetical protein